MDDMARGEKLSILGLGRGQVRMMPVLVWIKRPIAHLQGSSQPRAKRTLLRAGNCEHVDIICAVI